MYVELRMSAALIVGAPADQVGSLWHHAGIAARVWLLSARVILPCAWYDLAAPLAEYFRI